MKNLKKQDDLFQDSWDEKHKNYQNRKAFYKIKIVEKFESFYDFLSFVSKFKREYLLII